MQDNITICVVGCGYVGLPLAVLLSKHFKVYGFDVNENKIAQLRSGEDPTGDIGEKLKNTNIEFTNNPEAISKSNFIIIAVPTPITKDNLPDLEPLKKASEIVGKHIKKESTAVYESTVYPGVTEDVCIPILEKESGLKCGKDFGVGYSPERVVPGDKNHTIDKIVKVVSANDEETLSVLETVYSTICHAGLHKAPNIKTAEASKVIENVQRDLNIALVNELSLIFAKLGIDTHDVLGAAGTKWNFHKYTPGLVGGHCIGVDPYYLIYKSEELGHHPLLITAARRINNDMYKFVSEKVVRALVSSGQSIKDSRVVILGLTYKENVNDTRNSRLKHLIDELKTYDISIVAHDPIINNESVEKEFGVRNRRYEELSDASVIVLASPHKEFFTEKYLTYFREQGARNAHLIDIKRAFGKDVPKGLFYHTL